MRVDPRVAALRTNLSRTVSIYVATNINSFLDSAPNSTVRPQYSQITNRSTVSNLVQVVQESVISGYRRSMCCRPIPVVLCAADSDPIVVVNIYPGGIPEFSFSLHPATLNRGPTTNDYFDIGPALFTGDSPILFDGFQGGGVMLDRRVATRSKEREVLESIIHQR